MFLTRVLSAVLAGHHRRFNNKVKCVNPMRWWRLQWIQRNTWNRFGRSRYCRKLATLSMRRGLKFKAINEKVFARDAKQVCIERIDAAAREHHTTGGQFLEGLARSHVNLNSRVLADLAIYEPRTFESLADIAKLKCEMEGINDPKVPKVTNVDTNGKL